MNPIEAKSGEPLLRCRHLQLGMCRVRQRKGTDSINRDLISITQIILRSGQYFTAIIQQNDSNIVGQILKRLPIRFMRYNIKSFALLHYSFTCPVRVAAQIRSYHNANYAPRQIACMDWKIKSLHSNIPSKMPGDIKELSIPPGWECIGRI